MKTLINPDVDWETIPCVLQFSKPVQPGIENAVTGVVNEFGQSKDGKVYGLADFLNVWHDGNAVGWTMDFTGPEDILAAGDYTGGFEDMKELASKLGNVLGEWSREIGLRINSFLFGYGDPSELDPPSFEDIFA